MKKILIIDDSKSVHAFVKSCFAEFNFEVTSTFNGKEGLENLTNKKEYYDLILLDWEMPIMDGPTTLHHLQDLKLKTTLLMMTSRNAMEDIEKMLSSGASEYIMKPFTKDILLGKTFPFLGLDNEAAS